MRRLVLVAIAAFACAACSNPTTESGNGSSGGAGSIGGSGGTGSTGATFVHAAQRCQQLAGAACAHDAACGVLAQSDLGVCESTFGCDNAPLLALADAQVDAGLAGVDADALATCLSDITAAPCGETGAQAQHISTACAAVSRGPAAAGASCETGSDCGSASSCVRSSSACGGACTAWLTSGPCGLGFGVVAPGFACGDDGGVMAQFSQGTACNATKDCAPPLFCTGPAGARECLPVGTQAAGATCISGADCGPAFTCLDARVDAGGFCAPRVGAGGSCQFHFADGGTENLRDGGFRTNGALCLEEEFCQLDTATCVPNAPLGGACALDGGHPACGEGACLLQSDGGGVCGFAPTAAPCLRALDCASEACLPAPDGGGVCGAPCP